MVNFPPILIVILILIFFYEVQRLGLRLRLRLGNRHCGIGDFSNFELAQQMPLPHTDLS
jgi:hypothetical protein